VKRPLGVLLLVAVCTATITIPGTAQERVRLTGSGASFPFPLYSAWFKAFSASGRGIAVDYQAKGSGAGIQDLINHTVDFAASDAAMSDEDMAKVPGGVQLLPMTAGEIALAYNLAGVTGLKLPRDAYAAIFLGTLTKWSDPRLKAANPGLNLPAGDITVVRRADSSGTTFVFTNHLSAISAEWKKTHGSGTTVTWPSSDKFVAAPKNDGVAATIRQTPGSIGYVEYAFGKFAKLEMALLQNKAGQYMAAGTNGGAEALASVALPPDLRAWLPDPPGAHAYPIATYTWLLAYKKNSDAKKAAALRALVEYCLTEGQKMSGQMGYIPLPESVVSAVRRAAANIQS